MVKRFARIYPLYIICLVLYMALIGAHEWGHGPSLMDYVKHLLLLQTWWNYSHHVWLDPAWSLSAEWGSYALFPLCFLFMRLKSQREVGEWLIVLTAGFVVFHLAFAENNLRMIVQCGVFRAAPCFAIGILLYRLKQLTPRIPAYSGDIAAVMFFIAAIGLYFVDGSGFLLLPLSALLVFTFSYENGMASGLMASKSMMFLGKISYALYITHYLVYQVTVAMFDVIPVWYFPALFAGFIGIAWASHILIERPAQKFLTLALTPRAFARRHSVA